MTDYLKVGSNPPVTKKPRKKKLNGMDGVQLSQMDLVLAIMKHVGKTVGTMNMRQQNAIIRAADLIVHEFRTPHKYATPGMGYSRWLECDDVGVSSKWLAKTLAGSTAEYGHPHDPSDFMRCVKMVAACGFENRLSDVIAEVLAEEHETIYSVEWKTILRNWDHWVHLLNTDSKALYAEMKANKL